MWPTSGDASKMPIESARDGTNIAPLDLYGEGERVDLRVAVGQDFARCEVLEPGTLGGRFCEAPSSRPRPIEQGARVRRASAQLLRYLSGPLAEQRFYLQEGGQQGVESQQRQPKSDSWNAPPGHPLRVYSWRLVRATGAHKTTSGVLLRSWRWLAGQARAGAHRGGGGGQNQLLQLFRYSQNSFCAVHIHTTGTCSGTGLSIARLHNPLERYLVIEKHP